MVASAVRNERVTLAVAPFLLSYLYRGHRLTARDVRLTHGVIFRTYFEQFPPVEMSGKKKVIMLNFSNVASELFSFYCWYTENQEVISNKGWQRFIDKFGWHTLTCYFVVVFTTYIPHHACNN